MTRVIGWLTRARLRRFVDWTGRLMMTLGVLTLLFVAYQLWGTGIVEARQQHALKHDFRQELTQASTTTSTTGSSTPGTSTTTTTPPTTAPPQQGDTIGILKIPAIGVDKAIVQDVGRDQLAKGPGHYPSTVMPGHRGNAGIAGHRTTHGAPFYDLDKLKPGDEILITTLEGAFTYRVDHTTITDPKDVSVIAPTSDNRLTLTTCNPKYSARERLVVVADLEGKPIDALPPPPSSSETSTSTSTSTTTTTPAQLPRRLDGPSSSGLAATGPLTFGWGFAVLAVGAAWWAAFRYRRRWYVWIAGVLPFLVVLFFFYGQVEKLLPPNF